MNPEAQDIVVFLAVVRDGSFGRAAASLMVSQPAVSERVLRLERTMGQPLFIRGNRGVVLTAAGERLLPYAQRTVDLLSEAVDAVRAVDRPARLRIAVHSTFAHRAIPLVVSALELLPRSVKIRDAHSDEIVAMLLDGVVDVGFVLPVTPTRGLRYVPLPVDHVIGVCAPDHPLRALGRVRLEALAGTFVALNAFGQEAAAFLADLERSGVPEWRWRECSDASTAMRLARNHGHVALVTASSAAEDLAAGTLVEIALRPAPKWSVPLALVYRNADHDEPAVSAIRTAARIATA